WVAEYYGGHIWCAVRIPDNAFFVGANRARIDHVEWDSEDWLYCDDLYDFAVANGMTTASKEDFSPAQTYAPCSGTYYNRREWRGLMLAAPSLDLDPNGERFPLWVVPEKKLSVQDIFEFCGDYYQGTPYDVSKSPEAGPYGDPLVVQNVERTINLFRTCYVMIANVKAWLPEETRCLVWYGYGAPDSTYITPLWPTMKALPELYTIGSRYEAFDRNSGWWTNSYVQQVARINYKSAIQDIHAFRQPKMDSIYKQTEEVQAVASRLVVEGQKDAALDLLTTFGYNTAAQWHEDWLKLGDELLGRYMWGNKNMKTQAFDKEYKAMLDAARPTYNK
ncbi:MAG: C69 family dipeptidase, partial [Spirochaetales bacterium]|nr:C69 family dipeptidase [Candidatus Physcosoma equi]